MEDDTEADALFAENELAWEEVHKHVSDTAGMDLPTAIASIAKQLEEKLEMVRTVATGETQVADDDTDGMAWIADYLGDSK